MCVFVLSMVGSFICAVQKQKINDAPREGEEEDANKHKHVDLTNFDLFAVNID